MELLFIHQAFPAQFGRLALELTKRYGWKCRFLIEDLSTCPTPTAEMLELLQVRRIAQPEEKPSGPTPWPQIYGQFLGLCQRAHDSIRAWSDLKPDLVINHGGRGAPSMFLPEVVSCPIVNYCEYYFASGHSDISYRVDLPPADEVAPFFPKCINAPVLAGLVNSDAGYSATHWQRNTFPARYRDRIEVHFDGIDTELYLPRKAARTIAGRSIPAGTKVVTYVARGLESVRGFDVFVKVAARIARERSDVLFVVCGSDNIYYGWDALHTKSSSFRQWVMDRVEHDPEKFLFLGHITPEDLAELLCLSDLHVHLTVPFVLSWSFFNALACGRVVLGSDSPPVREVIDHGRNGLLEPLFDVDRLTATALRVLDDPAEFAPIGAAARATIEEKYSLDVCIPELSDYFERVARGPLRRFG